MTTQPQKMIAYAAVVGLALGTFSLSQAADLARSYSMKSKSKGVPTIKKQPEDQYVKLGGSAQFTVTAKADHLSYQWQLNCNTIPGETNRTYTIRHVTTNDVGSYTCLVSKEPEVIVTQPAYLMAYATNDAGFVVYHVPPPGGSGSPDSSGCPSAYVCYFNFKKTVAPFGWYPKGAPYTGPYSAQHLGSTLTDIKYFAGTIQGCGHGGFVTVGTIDTMRAYRFTVFCPSASFPTCPTGTQTLQLIGFIP